MNSEKKFMTLVAVTVAIAVVAIISFSFVTVKMNRLEKKMAATSSAIDSIESVVTELTTDSTTTTTTTAITQPEKPLIVLDMQRRLDTLMLMAKYAKPEVEKIMELQKNGGTLSDEQHSLLQWYAAVIIEENQLTNAINEKLEQ